MAPGIRILNKPGAVLLAHPGTQHSIRLAAELERNRLLGEYWTGVAMAENSIGASIANRLRRFHGLEGLGSRIVRGIPRTRLHTVPGPELLSLWRLRRGAEPLTTLHTRNAQFQQAIPDSNLKDSSAVIGFDTSSWILANRCLRLERPFYLDRTIAHPAALARLMKEIAPRYPGWVGPLAERPAELVAAEATEHERAYRIVVGGSFARDTLVAEGIDSAKIRINPYGVEWGQFLSPIDVPATGTRPLRFLFAGSVTARKGVPVLLDAWRRLAPHDAELWLAGHVGPRERAQIPSLPGLRLLGQVPHAEMAHVYAQCDVFVLPSFFEGFGLVILEALAAGLPVISTTSTGAREVVTDATLGHLVKAGSVDELQDAMHRYLELPPSRDLVRSAADKLRNAFSWQEYGLRWVTLLGEAS